MSRDRRPSSGKFMAAARSLAALLLTSAAMGQAPGSAGATAAPAQPTGVPHLAAEWWWPLQINTGGTTSTLYQPQLDSWDGYKLSARIAVRAAP